MLTEANDALASSRGYNPTSTARNGNGHHRGDGKPTDGDSQWLLQPGAKLPPRAFQVHPDERRVFWRMAQAVPLDGKEIQEVQRIGGAVFDGIFSEGKKFELEITAGRLELERLAGEKARLDADLTAIKPTTEQQPPVPQFPKLFSVPWWKFATCLLLFVISCGAAIANISSAYLPSVQSHLLAITVASPWVLAAVAAKLLTRGAQARTLTIVRWSVAGLGLLGLLLWLAGLCPLVAGLDLNNLASASAVIPDRRLAFVGQLLCEFAAGYLLITGMIEALSFEPVIIKNPNRTRIADCVADVVRQMDHIMVQLHKPSCNLSEWQASRTSFIEEGLTILRIRASDAAYIAELQRQRADNQRLLAAFNS
jgi:hypothetical protein